MHTRRKFTIFALLALISTALSFPAHAAYTPLVRLPGLPATGSISLSMYLVGLYNFLVSIVGIVAVLMMIVGGMRYITAGGSSTAISDAKDIVANAVYGLIIAIFAWVIVAAINPDVLYIKVGSGESAVVKYRFMRTFTPPNTCVCKDGYTLISPADDPLPTTEVECNKRCLSSGHGTERTISCTRGGVNDLKSYAFKADPNNGKCMCADGNDVKPKMTTPPNYDAATCDQACSTPAMVDDNKYHCGFDYLYIKADVSACCYDSSPFIADNTWELWEFFLSSRGDIGGFNNTARSKTVAPNTYECAIMITEEDTLSWDDGATWWVLPGTVIKRNGTSLADDISGKNSGCCDTGGTDCTSLGSDCAASVNGDMNDILNTKYTVNVTDKCGNCSAAASTTEYRPSYDILCDPVTGMWRQVYAY